MFYGYSIKQWVDLGIYMVGMVILAIVIYKISEYLANKYFMKQNKIYAIKKKSKKEKKWFYDVA